MSESKSRWGSLLSGAVAGLESRLDNILSDELQPSKPKPEDEATKKVKQAEAQNRSRATSKSRTTNDRLQARLAKAVKSSGDSDGGSRTRESSDFGSRPPSRTSKDFQPETKEIPPPTSAPAPSEPEPEAEPEPEPKAEEIKVAPETAPANVPPSAIPIAATDKPSQVVPPKSNELGPSVELESNPEPEPEAESTSAVAVAQPALAPPVPTASPATVPSSATPLPNSATQEELLTKNKEQAEELHRQLEKIDRLHANIKYLSGQLYENTNSAGGDEKDKKIAQLLDEGGKLSKVEEKLRGDIKYLRIRLNEEKQTNTDATKRLDKLEVEMRNTKLSLQTAEAREKSASDRLNSLHDIERELGNVKLEKSEAMKEMQGLGVLLEQAEQRADEAEKKANSEKLKEQEKVIADLKEEISNSKIEKKLVEDRAKAELNETKEEHERQVEKGKVSELELKAEIQNLEAKLEVLRLQTEQSSTSGPSDTAKLLRQIETLQSQYSLASDNWQGIEAGLNSRITALEKERDELSKREADARKKARDLNSKAKRLEEDLDAAHDDKSSQESTVTQLKTGIGKLETRLKLAEKEVNDARNDLEKERKEFENLLQTRIEEERLKWRAETGSGLNTPGLNHEAMTLLRNDSMQQPQRPNAGGSMRRSHTGNRGFQSDISLLLPTSPDLAKSPSRRSLASGQHSAGLFSPMQPLPPTRTPTDHSLPSLGASAGPTPPPIVPVAEDVPTLHADGDSDEVMSPQHLHGAAEMISISTSGAGPSVQLVERMSASVRRLEMEKAAAKEEIARLSGQRDEARNEVVSLMREMEDSKDIKTELEAMKSEITQNQQRYEAALEMIGEKSEECEELKHDVADLKKMYRELVENTVR